MKNRLATLSLSPFVLGIVLLVGACGDATPTPTAVPLEVLPNTMIIQDSTFHPKELTIKLGETVTFINRDDRSYALRDGTYGPDFYKGGLTKDQKWEFTFEKTGDFVVGGFLAEELRGMVHVTP